MPCYQNGPWLVRLFSFTMPLFHSDFHQRTAYLLLLLFTCVSFSLKHIVVFIFILSAVSRGTKDHWLQKIFQSTVAPFITTASSWFGRGRQLTLISIRHLAIFIYHACCWRTLSLTHQFLVFPLQLSTRLIVRPLEIKNTLFFFNRPRPLYHQAKMFVRKFEEHYPFL